MGITAKKEEKKHLKQQQQLLLKNEQGRNNSRVASSPAQDLLPLGEPEAVDEPPHQSRGCRDLCAGGPHRASPARRGAHRQDLPHQEGALQHACGEDQHRERRAEGDLRRGHPDEDQDLCRGPHRR